MNARKILGFAIGPITSAALSLVTLPIMAWAFSPEDIGRLNLLQVTLSFTLLLGVLGLDQAYVREYHGSKNQSALLKACFAPGFVLLFACALITAAFRTKITTWLFGESNSFFYAMLLLCVMINYVSRFLSLILRMQERGLAFSMSQVIPKVLQLVLLVAVIFLGIQRSFLTLLWIFFISILAVVLVYAWNTRTQWRPALKARPSAHEVRSLLQFGFPLVFSGLAYWGLTTTSILVLRSKSNLGELGIYSVTGSIASVATIFQSIFSVVWAPMIYKWVNQGVDMTRVDKISRQALFVVCLIFSLAGCFSWLTDYVLPLHYINVKYLVVGAIAPPLLYTLSEITCIGIAITRRTALTVWITLAALATNMLISLWLVPTQGAAGAVIANALSYVVFFIARTEVSAKVWRQSPRLQLHIHVLLFIGLAIGTVCLGPDARAHTIGIVWLFALFALYFSMKNEIQDFLTLTFQKFPHLQYLGKRNQ